jgi:hypothetical protein
MLHQAMRRQRPSVRIALFLLNVVLAWSVAASIAFAILG